ncbi:MAG: TIM barrel protein [Thermomicrobiales bacterium]|nr:TIM barrel protein [Thermomicrobiales bacterium]
MAEIVDMLQDLGVDAIELWPGNLPGGSTPAERERYETKDIAGVQALLAARGMAVSCTTLGFGVLAGCRDHGAAHGTAALEGAVDAAAALGAPIVNCYLAGLAPDLFVEAVKPAASYAAARGVTIVLENEAHDESGPAANMRAIADTVDSSGFGLQYDPCNFYHANEEPYPAAYETIKPHIRYVHLKGGCCYDPVNRPADHKGGLMRERDDAWIGYTYLPDGVVNVEGVVRRLAADGYDGYVTLEPHVDPADALAYYRIEVPYVRELLARHGAAAGTVAP